MGRAIQIILFGQIDDIIFRSSYTSSSLKDCLLSEELSSIFKYIDNLNVMVLLHCAAKVHYKGLKSVIYSCAFPND
jgi:hypothetical protein